MNISKMIKDCIVCLMAEKLHNAGPSGILLDEQI